MVEQRQISARGRREERRKGLIQCRKRQRVSGGRTDVGEGRRGGTGGLGWKPVRAKMGSYGPGVLKGNGMGGGGWKRWKEVPRRRWEREWSEGD